MWIPASSELLLLVVELEAAAAVLECELVGGWEALSVRVKAPLKVCEWAPRLGAPSVHRSEQALAMKKAMV